MLLTNSQIKVLNSLNKKPHGRLLLSPRFGKSILMIEIIKINNPKNILWVTPSKRLAKTEIYNEFLKFEAVNYLDRLKTITYSSLNKLEGSYELIILDEEQCVTNNNTINLFNKKIKYEYICSMTGSPTEHQEKKDIYNNLKLKILYKLDVKEAVEKNILSNYNIFVEYTELNSKIRRKRKNAKFPTTEYKDYEYACSIVKNSIKMNDISKIKMSALFRQRIIKNSISKYDLAKKLYDRMKGRTIIFCPTIDIAKNISKYNYHSKSSNIDLNKFINEEIEKISMVNSGGVGYTYKNVKNIVIIQVDSNKNGNTLQKCCRGLLKEDNKVTNIIFIVLKRTKDEDWLKNVLKQFHYNKIYYNVLQNELKKELTDK